MNMIHYILLGERCSGTNIIEKVISANSLFRPDWSLVGFKHFPRHDRSFKLFECRDIPVILVVRESVSWLRSFYNQPWHASPLLKSMSFSEFIRSEWKSVWDSDTNTPSDSDDFMKEILLDRNPYTGERYDNVISLRTGKLKHMLEIYDQLNRKLIVRLEDYQSSPGKTIQRILSTLGSSVPDVPSIPSGYKANTTVISRSLTALGLASIYKSRTQLKSNNKCLSEISPDDFEYIKSNLDPLLEARVGYYSE